MFLCGDRLEECVKMVQWDNFSQARMVKSADTADLKSADPYQVVGVQVPLRAP
jgi:hypothetical protein